MSKPTVSPELRFATLAGMLRARASERPGQVAFTFLADGETEAGRLSYADLDGRARRIAAALREVMAPGERALLLYPPGLDFIAAFFGCLYAGVVAVPAYPPRSNDRSQSRLRSIARDAEPRAALTTSAVLAGTRGLEALAPELAAVRWIATDALVENRGVEDELPEPDSDSLAFLQYTSGSTAEPKGVEVTHANLLHNERMIGAAFEQDESSVVVGWLPLHHDMGLIGNVLQPLHAGGRCVLMSPVSFLQRPLRWLEAISRFRGTTSGGPDFAYELCVRKASPESLAGLDLSSWRVAFNGAEPVRAETLERFAATFAPCGFRPEAFYPCYGLAEATLFVAGGVRGRPPRVAQVEAAALERDEVVAATPESPGSRRLVSCGRPWMGQRVVVADPETGMESLPGRVGEVWLSGPSVARGYWQNPEATARDFNAFLPSGDGPFLRTGDLGFVADGELYVTGRLKDLIILRGRNHYPQDLERTAEVSHPDLRTGGGAAFSVEAAGEERLVIVLEVERRRRDGFEEVAEAVRRAVAEEHEVQVWEVVLIRAGSLPKTSSGKVQRGLSRRLYREGELTVVGRSALAATDPAPEIGIAVTRDVRGGLAALELAERRPMLEAWLRERAAAVLGMAASRIGDRQPLTGLGLDSLTAVELKGSVEAELGLPVPLSELLRGAGIAELADGLLAGLDGQPAGDVPPPRALSLQGDQPLSPGQRALWFLERLAPEAGAYNVVIAARVRGGLDAAALERALKALVDRHAALRTVIREVEGEPVRQVLPEGEMDFQVAEAEVEWAAEAWRPFDLERESPMRVRLEPPRRHRTDPTDRTDPSDLGGVLLFAVHHLAVDFASLAVLARDLGVLYARETGAAVEVPDSPALTYSDFVHWQTDLLARRGEALWEHWRAALDGVRDLDLPTDRPRLPVQGWRGLSRSAELPADVAGALRGLAAARGATPFMVLLSAFQAQQGRYAGQDDFAVGTPTAGRSAPEWAGVVGYFVNPVALRADLTGDPSFSLFLDRTRTTALAGLEHADFPLVLLAERLRPDRDPARSPLFQVMLTLQQRRAGDDPGLPGFALGEDGARISLGPLELESIALAERRAQFEVSLNAAELPSGGFGLSLEVDAGLFDAATAERMLGHFRTLLTAAVAAPELALSDLPLLTESERTELLADWQATAEPSGPVPAFPLHELVAAQAGRSPSALAVVAGEERLTYAELVSRADTLARHLQRMGVEPEAPVGLCVERSTDLVTGALGILAAGGVYLPLDPDSSAARLAFMIEDAGARVVITQRAMAARLPATITPLLLDDLPPDEGGLPARVLPGHLAYLIYTSGSTGRPKGVAVTHGAAVEHCLTWARVYGMTAGDRVLQLPSAGFDAAVEQTFSTLLVGATLVLRGPELWGTRELSAKIAELGLTVVDLPTAFFSRWVQDVEDLEAPASLRLVGTYGEELKAGTVRRWSRTPLARVPLLNCYGPTEAVVSATLHAVQTEEAETGVVPIGRSLPGRAARVLDRHGHPQPVGISGELCLGGLLARGYLGRPDFTAERFVPDPFGARGSRLYRTGDLARRRADGTLEFLGRLDDQVKIRGVRVEPGEVEVVLMEHPGVREASVLALGDPQGEPRLVAFVAPGLPEDLQGFLRERLPDAMIPSAWLALPALPLNVNGKVDRTALARLATEAGALEEAGSDAPRTPDEEMLAGIWADLLGRERVGIHDDFFALGGHSLLATRAVARISRVFGVDLPLAALFQAPTVARLAERITATSRTEAAPPVRPVPRVAGEALPLSFAQRRLWFLEQLQPGTALYNVPGEVRLAGPLDVPALTAAFGEVLRRHEALRTVFPQRSGEPEQRIEPYVAVELPVIDLTDRSDRTDLSEAERLAAEEAARPFDLAHGPVCRGLLLRLGPEEHRLLVTFHHIAADGWSLGLFLDELSALYGGAPPLPGLAVQYPDYAVWQQEGLRGETLEDQLAYWRSRLTGLPVLELPVDRPRGAVRDGRGAVRSLRLPAEVVATTERLARREGVTLFMALLGVFQVLLARLTGEAAIPVGTPVANRRRPEVERLIGLFVNTLVLAVEVGDDPALSGLLARVREAALGAYAHQDLPFERLVEELQPDRALGQNPLFQVMLVLEEPLPARTAAGLTLEPLRRHSGTAKFDLLLAVSPRDGGWDVVAEYPTALFDPSTIDRLLGHWRTLLEGAAVADPTTRLSDLPMLTAAEQQQVSAEWNDTGTAFPAGLCLHDLVAAQAARTPEAVAVVGERERVTYRELRARAGSLARYLRAQGVGPEVRVGLCLERTPDLVAAILGILEAGGAYVPLDPAYPQERLDLTLTDSGAELLLTESALAGRFEFFAGAMIMVDRTDPSDPTDRSDEVANAATENNLAYVIYTSGSTGRPKGVGIEHRSAVTFVHWALEAFPRADLEGVLAATSVCFDLSIFEIFVPLATGGKVILAPNVIGLPQLAVIHEVTLVNAVPSPMAELVSSRLPAGLRTVNLAGEALKADLVERIYAHPQVERVYNLYGPSEDTTYSTWTRVPRGTSLVTIGRPLANTWARVLGRQGEELPVGVPGELFLGGDGLARSYLGRPELTADRFVPDSSGPPGARMYRTGDGVRRLPDGQLEFLGRLDHQVKLHGIRIELGEIEAALARHPAVRQAVVLLRTDGPEGAKLVAYVVPRSEDPDPAAELASFLRGFLPVAMVPTAWVILEALPLSPNGKVDRRALPAPERSAPVGDAAPRNPTEERLAAVWREVLGLERLGIHDDFFALGGHSLLAVRAAFRTAEAFGTEVPVAALFQAPTVAALAEWLERAHPEPAAAPIPAAPVEGPYPLSLAQQRLWLLDRLESGSTAYNVGLALRLKGPLDAERLAASLGEVVRRHEPLRTVYAEGPEEGEPVQVILSADGPVPLERIELDESAVRDVVQAEVGWPFDLRHGPVARFLLLRSGEDEHVLVITVHHIAVDGWSFQILLRDLAAIYASEPLPPLPLRYVDWAVWQHNALSSTILDEQLAFWRRELGDAPALELPTDRPRPAMMDRAGASRRVDLPPDLINALRERARSEGTTLFAVLLGGFFALLGRYSGQEDFAVGIASAGRSRRELEEVVGFFVSTLALRSPLAGDPGCGELVRRVRDRVREAQTREDVPFERVVEELGLERDPARTPVFQAMLSLLSAPAGPPRLPGLEVDLVEYETTAAKLDLTMGLHEMETGVSGGLEYRTSLFEPVTIDRMLGHWRTLLSGMAAADPAMRLSQLSLLTAAERQQVSAEWNDTEAAFPAGPRLQDLVAAQAVRTPDAVAVVGEGERVTYTELVARAGRLARYLRALGVGPEVRVGLCLERTPDLVAAILGILEAGGAYVPLDPGYPQERLELMLTDSGAELLVTDAALAGRFGFFAGSVALMDRTDPTDPTDRSDLAEATEGNLAYVIYTSGSTGRPKGVGIEHRSAVTLVQWAVATFPRADLEGVLAATSACFDLSIFEIFVPLAVGGKVILAPNVIGLPQLAAIDEVTLVNAVPSPMAELVSARLPTGLRTVNLAGEALKADLVERIYAHPQVERVYNLYGPSEDTTYSTWARVPRGTSLVTIGRPLANTRARVLDEHGEELPVGVPGELFLGGAGLARSYLGRPDLTAERFVPDPAGPPGARMYRTGDRARRLGDGQLDFLGRLDHQVKLHGIRIELGEIEAALESHPAVKQAVAALRSDGPEGARLVGYVVAQGENQDLGAELAAFLRELLPAPMVPKAWVILPALPLSPNGKVDRRALPAPERSGPVGDVAPRNPTEEKLAAIWREVLGLERLGIHDDFFALGGHSLLAVRAAFRTAEAFGIEVPVTALLQAPTVAAFAEWLEHARPETLPAPLFAAQVAGSHPLSFAQQRLWFLDRLEPGSAAYNVGLALRLKGRLDEERLAASLEEVVRRHEPLRTVYVEGPEGGEPVQIVLPAGGIALERIELDAPAVHYAVQAEMARPFDLQRGPVARFLLVRLGEEEHVLVLTVHHIAADGWSLQILLRDLAAIYASEPLPPLPLRYVDWAFWQRRVLATAALDEQLAFWRRELAGVPALELPTERPRPPVMDRGGASRPVDLPPELVLALRERARDEGTTLFAVLLSGFFALLGCYTGQQDFAVGTVSAGRSRRELAEMIGFFVSTLALRAPLAGDPDFRQLLRRVRERVREAQANEDAPFERVVEELQPERDPARTPVFQAMLSFLSTPGGPPRLPGLEVEFVDGETTAAKLDLMMALHELEAGVAGRLEYRSALFEPATILRMTGHFRALLAEAAADPARPLSALPLLAPAERWQLAAEWNDTAMPFAQDLGLHDLVALQAARTPEAPAVLSDDGAILTYGELMARTRSLAGRLRLAGVGPERVVGLCVERSPEMVIGMLAILEAGGAWLPLDPNYPAERLALVLNDAGSEVALTREALRDRLPDGVRTVTFENEAENEIADGPRAVPGNLACVLYTSGSTGRPKGVMLPHRGLVNRLLWAQETYRLTVADAVLFKAAFSFDFSIWEVFAPLLAGARLVVARPDGHQDPAYLARTIADRGVTLAHFVPTLLAAFLREEGVESCTALRQVFSGGEALSPELRDRFFSRLSVPLDNQYGPTEISIDTTRWVCAPGQSPHRVPLGRPIANARIELLDVKGQPVPVGVTGRLHVGGPGVARGYLGRPDLTAERFVPDPQENGERLYNTGDLARRLPDGTLEFMGRADQQIKVRGVRIEPGEVEAALLCHPQVKAAAVAANAAGERLMAWIVAEGDLAPAALRDFLRTLLPEAMVPPQFIRLAALPLTATGKLDRRALPEPEEAVASFAAPASATEELLTGLWADVLGMERAGQVGRDADFFDLGGHSLLATRLISRVRAAFGVDLPVSALFEAPTPAALARRLAAAQGEPAAPPIVPVTREPEGMPLSYSQRRLWFLHRLEPRSPAYNVPGALRLRGPLSVEALAAALSGIVRRHEALRTVFRNAMPEPLQVILEPSPWGLPVIDLSGLPEDLHESEARRLLAEEAGRPFDLAAGPLARTSLLRLRGEDHLFAVSLHHIVSDAWSLPIMLRELAVLYRGDVLPDLPVQYADFAAWERSWLAGEVLAGELAHWQRVLAGAPESLDLPTDRPRPPGTTGASPAGQVHFSLPSTLADDLRLLSRREGWTLFMALLAAFDALLCRHAPGMEPADGDDPTDLIVGAPIANRNRLEIEGLIGFFTNTLALRTSLAGDPSFAEIARRVRAATLEAYAHHDLPFERLVEELAPERRMGRTPLFQVMLVLRNPVADLELPGIAAELMEVELPTAKFDLTLYLGETEGGLAGSLEFNRDLFDETTAGRLVGRFATLLTGAVAMPEARLSDLPLLTTEEQEQLLAWSENPVPHPQGRLLHELVAAQAARTPDAEAVIFGPDCLTYAELERRAGTLARHLRSLGVGPDVPVGIQCERSLEQWVAVLAALKAGGAYLPLDPTHPPERLRLMVEDAGAPVVLTQTSVAEIVGAGGDGELEDPRTGSRNLAYLLYTSGSTGRPKGVAMTHEAAVNLVSWQLRASGAGVGTRTLQFAPLGFDVSFQEAFSTWASGGALVLVCEETRRDAPALLHLLAAERVERLFVPLVALQQLAVVATDAAETGTALALREVMAAGEQLYVTPQVRSLFASLPGGVLQNHYGPTETHAVTWLALDGDPTDWPERPTIGRPLDNARIFLLGADREPLPPGVPGELCVGGVGLARGYLARPDLTAERFVPDPFATSGPGERLYRTGDLARWLPDGTLELLGRSDHQVKVRGFRIELAEVEIALARHQAVLQAVAGVRGGEAGAGTKRLAAWCMFRDGMPAPSWSELRDFLAETLPDFMVPTLWMQLDALPLTSSGKVSRRALPAPEDAAGGGHFAAPMTPLEELLAGIWSDVLGVERIGLHDSFFGLGGHSLLATQVVSRVREACGVDLPLRRLFEAPTLEELARAVEAIRESGREAPEPILPLDRGTVTALPLSFAQERLWFIDQLQSGGSVYNVPLVLRLRGRLDAERLAAALREVARRHETLRTVFPERDGEPAQEIAPPASVAGWALPRVDLAGLPATVREAERERLAAEESGRPFDLARDPLWRAALLRLGPEDHVLLLALHHIVSDLWSLGVLMREVSALYTDLLPLPELAVQYSDFAAWQRSWLAGERLERQIGYWRWQLQGLPAVLELPTDHPRPPVMTSRGAQNLFALNRGLSSRLAVLARREGATPFMVLAAAFLALLGRLSGQRDLAVGSPIANRNRLETEGLIGFFVNTLVLRADLGKARTGRDLLRQLRETTLGAYAHQDLPFEKLVEELQPVRDLAHTPFFQVVLVLQNAPLVPAALPGLVLEPEEAPAGTAKFDLSLILADSGDGLAGWMEYRTDLFDGATITRWISHFETLLEGFVAAPGTSLEELPILSEGARRQLLVEWNPTSVDFEPDVPVHHRVMARAAEAPETLALAADGVWITYGELAARARGLARRLRTLGIGPEVRVPVLMERSAGMVLAQLAVLAAGGAYVPLDPAHPRERLEWQLADAWSGGEVRVLVAQEGLEIPEELEAQVLRLQKDGKGCEDSGFGEALELEVVPENAAYVIYTSGSTGRPKGVMISHRSLANTVAWHCRVYALDPADRATQIAAPGFDATVVEIWPYLATGASLHVPGDEIRAVPAKLIAWLAAEEISVCFLPTPLAEAALAEPWPEGMALRALLAGGARLHRGPRAELSFALLDNYGPTESTVVTTWNRAEPEEVSPPIGRPVDNTHIHVLDAGFQPVPIGVPGELAVGGAGLARGYLGRPDLTAERFVPDPFGKAGERLYRTGDRVRWRPDGKLEFLGRTDFQVKIRGHRIELEEIEAALRRLPAVREAVVVAREDRLVGYVVASGAPAPAPGELREALLQTLPEPMVPWTFVLLDALPLTANGKVDRAALPAPSRSTTAAGSGFVAPRSGLERQIGAVWREVLQLPEVGVHDNFFESGGNSLRIVKLHSRLEATLGTSIPVMELFRHPTIESLARRLAEEPRAEAVEERTESARVRTRGRQEALRQMSQARANRRGRNERSGS